MSKNNIIYVGDKYIKDELLKEYIYISGDEEDEILGNIWRNYDFEKAKQTVFELQCKLTKAIYNRNPLKIKKIQDKIVYSTEAKMLSVRQVTEVLKAIPGIDDITWRKDSDKMRAVINLNKGKYVSKPLKYFEYEEKFTLKKRGIGVPTMYDRAMQVLYSFALEPVEEATGDRKSFAFRKGRSAEQAHSYIMHALTDINPPEWILISDIKAYYSSISHNWLINNIMMDKYILTQFLKSGYVFNGEIFNEDEGISLGCNLSTILGNMALDGLQKLFYDMQGETVTDYYNGYCVRFADDIFITARTQADAVKFKEELAKFVRIRGLELSERKTKIVNIKQGFDFLSRYYCKIDGIIRCIPSENSIRKFEKSIEEHIFQKSNWSQAKLIESINAKIIGFATYHKCSEAHDAFIHIDVIINALLLQYMKRIYPNIDEKQLIKKYWKKDYLGRDIFTLRNNQKKTIYNMADTVLICEKPIDLSKNVFLDKTYFKQLKEDKEIQNVVGKYRKVWDRQDGICYICSKKIELSQEKSIIKKKTKYLTIKNMAYAHKECEKNYTKYFKTSDITELKMINLNEVLNNNAISKNKKKSKFVKLEQFFHNSKKNIIKLKFKDIEKILGFKLCDSAYKYASYFKNNNDGMISKSWISQGYEISKLDIKKEKIEFVKCKFSRKKIIIPRFMYKNDLPMEMVDECKSFFVYLQEKYRLS